MLGITGHWDTVARDLSVIDSAELDGIELSTYRALEAIGRLRESDEDRWTRYREARAAVAAIEANCQLPYSSRVRDSAALQVALTHRSLDAFVWAFQMDLGLLLVLGLAAGAWPWTLPYCAMTWFLFALRWFRFTLTRWF
jgi:hypothetical protein